MPDRLRVRGWCEDREHEVFARRLFKRHFGITEPRQIQFFVAPQGHGSAAAWVVKKYPEICKQARATRHQTNLRFVLIIDADRFGVNERLSSLKKECRIVEPSDAGRIATVIPAWEIETWVEWLCQLPADENRKSTLSKDEFRDLLPKAIEAWVPARGDEADRIPSLSHGREQLGAALRP